MRGKVGVILSSPVCVRITPAHAGKSHAVKVHLHRNGDHPRPCGEKITARGLAQNMRGSPPPMRGKDGFFGVGDVKNRITPAHAGKRFIYSEVADVLEDHPRPCGEKQYE